MNNSISSLDLVAYSFLEAMDSYRGGEYKLTNRGFTIWFLSEIDLFKVDLLVLAGIWSDSLSYYWDIKDCCTIVFIFSLTSTYFVSSLFSTIS